jgi:DNA repair exonuclease SbcCD nuclease subunit
MLAYRDFAKSEGLRIIFLGDLYHTHAMVRSEVHQFWFDYFNHGHHFSGKPFVIIGNHDMANQVLHAMESESPIKTLPNIVPVASLTCFENIYLAPYCHTPEMFHKELGVNPKGILLCHQEFAGFRYETGMETSPNAYSPAYLKAFDLVLSGHIHKHQIANNVHYVGAPYHQKKSDWQNPRHVAILNAATASIEYISPFLDISPLVPPPAPTDKAAAPEVRKVNNFQNLDEIVDFVIQSKYDNEQERRQYKELARKYLSGTS